ncbi:MAG TPA: adenylate/guanylate cyclase domain-containing protein [Rhodospirillaceae bacterium]|nr:MAG: hypothetical protein A2018_03380 [Alphaproteobacteria bacterium GWF2_58_20]HAU29610.1 adenylate/guanylate cyclase domain-containing protein [Rhodospirillaceae bacterium]
MRKNLTGHKTTILVALAILAGAVAIRLHQPEFLRRMQASTFDTYNRLWPRPFNPGIPVRIADFGDDTLARMGQWPWPRDRIATLVDRLSEMGASAIVFDMVFAEPDARSPRALVSSLAETPEMAPLRALAKTLPDTDALLALSIRKAGNVVTGFSFSNRREPTIPIKKRGFVVRSSAPNLISRLSGLSLPRNMEAIGGKIFTFPGTINNLAEIDEAAAENGHFSLSSDDDGVLRTYQLLYAVKPPETQQKSFYPALGLAAVDLAGNKESIEVRGLDPSATSGGLGAIRSIRVGTRVIPTTEDAGMQLYFSGHRPERFLQVADILSGKVSEEDIRGRIILIGTSASGLMDLRFIPLSQRQVPGVEIHAEAIEQILDGTFLQRNPLTETGEILGMILAGLLLIWLLPKAGAMTSAAIGAATIISGLAISIAGYRLAGLLIDPVYPAAATLLVYITCLSLGYLNEERKRRQIRTAFAHYLSPDLIEELAEKPEDLRLGGEVRPLTVMFSDIRGFSAISENFSPEKLTQTLNDFLTPMTRIIMNNKGTIDKYIGDAIMAFWNAPLANENHGRDACMAGLAMQDALAERNRLPEYANAPLFIGIGINTGPCCVGNMGSDQRFAYSAIGDAVNLASRLEGQTKTYHVPIIIGEATRDAIPDFATLEIDLITVKGKTRPERIFALIGLPETAETESFAALKHAHTEMLSAYRAQRWDEARQAMSACQRLAPARISGLYELYAQRIDAFSKSTPGTDWDGVYIASGK